MSRAEQPLSPSARAAQSSAGHPVLGGARRGYPEAPAGLDAEATPVQLAATRALLHADTPEDVLAALVTFVHDLGGSIVPARLAKDGAALPLDVSLGLVEPLVPFADPVSVTRMRLEAVLPQFVEDAKHALNRMRVERRKAIEAETDPLTGLLTRRAWMRRVNSGDRAGTLALIDLDFLKTVNDTHGHGAGDDVLQAAGALLRECFREDDAAGRFGGDEFACMARGLDPSKLAARMDIMRQRWRSIQPIPETPVGLSVGVADIRGGDLPAALLAADRALYRVKNAGRDCTAIAGDADYLGPDGETRRG